MSETWRVLVAGCGYVGCALAQRLAGAGHAVWGLRRRPSDLPGGVLPLAANLSDPASLRDLPPGLDFVVYTAAADRSDEAAYRAAYVDGLTNLLDALAGQNQHPRRVLFTSSTAVYDQKNGEWVDEDSPTQPGGFRGRIMLEGEKLVRSSTYAGTILRLGGIYGPGRTRLIDQVRSGQAVCSTGEPIYSNRIHRDDCTGGLYHLLALPEPCPVYLGVDQEPADLCTIKCWLAARLDVPMPQVISGGETARSNKRCSSRRLVESGYQFLYPTYREGLGSLLKGEGYS